MLTYIPPIALGLAVVVLVLAVLALRQAGRNTRAIEDLTRHLEKRASGLQEGFDKATAEIDKRVTAMQEHTRESVDGLDKQLSSRLEQLSNESRERLAELAGSVKTDLDTRQDELKQEHASLVQQVREQAVAGEKRLVEGVTASEGKLSQEISGADRKMTQDLLALERRLSRQVTDLDKGLQEVRGLLGDTERRVEELGSTSREKAAELGGRLGSYDQVVSQLRQAVHSAGSRFTDMGQSGHALGTRLSELERRLTAFDEYFRGSVGPGLRSSLEKMQARLDSALGQMGASPLVQEPEPPAQAPSPAPASDVAARPKLPGEGLDEYMDVLDDVLLEPDMDTGDQESPPGDQESPPGDQESPPGDTGADKPS